MNRVIAYQNEASFDRKMFSLSVPNLQSPLPKLELPSPNFVLFIACDARGIPDSVITGFAREMVERGAVYICAWGAECERFDTLFDLVAVNLEIEEGQHLPIMTTWHHDESLDEALWFALNVAYPDEKYADSCGAALAVSVANPPWDAQIHERLLNPSQLNADVVNEG